MAADDDDVLTYKLGTNGQADFDINAATGQLLTKGDLDFEAGPGETHTVQVTATDPYGEVSSALSVTINVVNVEELPEISGAASVNFDELA